jgi:hypothetical protein
VSLSEVTGMYVTAYEKAALFVFLEQLASFGAKPSPRAPEQGG